MNSSSPWFDYLFDGATAISAIVLMIFATIYGLPAVFVAYKVGFYFDLIQYVVSNGVDPSNIIVGPMPHDCEWDKAPLGNKYCRYVASWNAIDRKIYVSWVMERL